jgi:hypothetical protein
VGVLSSSQARWMPILGYVSRRLAHPEHINGDNGARGKEHRKLGNTLTTPSQVSDLFIV